jgi:hypothetical protein
MVTTAIERSLISNTVVLPARAGFWRRAAALFIDLFVIGLIVQVITIFAYGPSGGRVQSSGVLGALSRAECQMLSALPPGIEVPASFQANYAGECVLSIFGYPMGHVIIVGRHTDHGAVQTDVTVTFDVDDQRTVIRWPSLDLLVLPIVILLRLLLDRGKGGLGRRMVGIRLVRAGETESEPASMSALAKRYAAFAFIYAPLWLVFLYQGFFPGFALFDRMLPVLIGAVALTALLILGMVVTIIRRRDAFYDRIAQTRVMLVPPAAG